jgi:hypothetical protein
MVANRLVKLSSGPKTTLGRMMVADGKAAFTACSPSPLVGADRADLHERSCPDGAGGGGGQLCPLDMDGLKIALEYAHQIDDRVRALDGALDRRWAGEVCSDSRHLADTAQRLEEPGFARIALRDAEPGTRLQQRLAHISANESAAAEDGNEGRNARVCHALILGGFGVETWPCPWAKRHLRASGERPVDRVGGRPLVAAAYLA